MEDLAVLAVNAAYRQMEWYVWRRLSDYAQS